MKYLLLSLLLFTATVGTAAPVDVDGTILEIPSPAGFTAITPKMTAIYDFQKSLWAATTVHYFTFIRDSEIPVALKNEVPNLERNLVVIRPNAVVGKVIRATDFSELKRFAIAQNGELTEEGKKGLAAAEDRFNALAAGQSDGSMKMHVAHSTSYPAHEDTSRTFAFSALNRYEVKGADGKPSVSDVSMTTTFVHVRGKLLFLYAYALPDDLIWTRDASKQWASAIIEANPSDEKSLAAENSTSPRGGVDWGQAITAGLFGTAVLTLIDVIRKRLASRRSKDNQIT
jgi:hypothetical protein